MVTIAFGSKKMSASPLSLLGLQNITMILPSNLSIYESVFRKMFPIRNVSYFMTDSTLYMADNILIVSSATKQNYQICCNNLRCKNVIYLDLDNMTNSFAWFSKVEKPWKYQLYVPSFDPTPTSIDIPIISLIILDDTENAHLLVHILLEQFKYNQFVVAGYSNLLYDLCCGYDLIPDFHMEQNLCSFLYKSRNCDLILNTYTFENSEVFEEYLKDSIADLVVLIENNSVTSISSESYFKFNLHDYKESGKLLYDHIVNFFNQE